VRLDVAVLASGSIQISANFWAGAGVVAAVAAIVVAVLLWYLGSPRRLLLYSLTSQTALLTRGTRQRAVPDLAVTLSGEPLDDPHVASLQIESRGRRDIRGADFENTQPLKLDVGTPVLKLLDSETGGTAMPEIKIATEGSAVVIGPSLIKGGQVIIIDLLTDGPVTLTCPSPALADVTVRERRANEIPEPRWLRRSQASGVALIAISFLLIQYLGPPPSSVKINAAEDIGALAFIVGFFVLFVPTIYYQVGKRREAYRRRNK